MLYQLSYLAKKAKCATRDAGDAKRVYRIHRVSTTEVMPWFVELSIFARRLSSVSIVDDCSQAETYAIPDRPVGQAESVWLNCPEFTTWS